MTPPSTPSTVDTQPEGQPSAAPPFLRPGHTYATITDKIRSLVLTRYVPFEWYLGLTVGFILQLVLLCTVIYLLTNVIGMVGVNIQLACGFAFGAFVWSIGIHQAG